MVGFTGGRAAAATTNTARLFVMLKPLEERKRQRRPGDRAAARASGRGAGGARILPGGAGRPHRAAARATRSTSTRSRGTTSGSSTPGARGSLERLRALPQLVDLSSDQQDGGAQSSLVIDRGTASRLGITPQLIDDTLYDAFGQRQVATCTRR